MPATSPHPPWCSRVLGGTVLGLAGKRIGWLAPGGYLAVVLAGSAANAKDLDTGAAVRLPVCSPPCHMALGRRLLLSPMDLIGEPDS